MSVKRCPALERRANRRIGLRSRAYRGSVDDPQCPRQKLLARSETFIHGTTRAINAILTGTTARTAFLTTAGHPDILVLREGGRLDPFDFTVPFPEPYVPRALTFEVPNGSTRPAV
jgi:N-methylhydantoinase A/oxoprolinase/acetone carboxylase beta subunit